MHDRSLLSFFAGLALAAGTTFFTAQAAQAAAAANKTKKRK